MGTGRTGDRELNMLKSTCGPSRVCKLLLLHPQYVTHYLSTYNLKFSIIVLLGGEPPGDVFLIFLGSFVKMSTLFESLFI